MLLSCYAVWKYILIQLWKEDNSSHIVKAGHNFCFRNRVCKLIFSSTARVSGPDFQKSICVHKMDNYTHKWPILYTIIHFAYVIICFWVYNACTWNLVSKSITPFFENLVHIAGLSHRRKLRFFLFDNVIAHIIFLCILIFNQAL